MTTSWNTDRRWDGLTVAVLGTGPSLTPAAVQALSTYPCIAVNEAVRLAPQADLLVGLDGNWPAVMREFGGVKLCGVEDDSLGAFYIGHRYERARMGDGHVVEFRNSGMTAIRIAADLGAARVVLVGFDPEVYGEPGEHYAQCYAVGLQQLVDEMAARGVHVERFVMPQPPEEEQKPAAKKRTG